MRAMCLCLLAIMTATLAGCTEMRVEGDAKIFQSSAMGKLIQTVIGIALLGVGGVAIAGGTLPDKKPKKRSAKRVQSLTSGQRVSLIVFGGSMAFMGLFLAGASLIFPKKLHVTVYPDRVSMASTYSQTGGKERVIPFSSLASVELRDERNIVGKLKPYLVFTQHDGNVIRQEAGNNEKKAVETIRQALADFQTDSPPDVQENAVAAGSVPEMPASPVTRPIERPTAPADPAASSNFSVPTPDATGVFSPVTSPQPTTASFPANGSAASASEQYSLKRYEITIPLPAGYSVVGPETDVAVGSKLKACYAGGWSSLTVVAINDDGTITCNWDSYRSYTYKMMREDLIVGKEGESTMPSEVLAKQYSLKRYKISIPVPRGYAVVQPASEVKVGMKLGACYAGGWEFVTVVAINDDGTITCNWDNYPSFTYKMMREDLTMAK